MAGTSQPLDFFARSHRCLREGKAKALRTLIMVRGTAAAVPALHIGFEESEGFLLGSLQGQPDVQIPPDPAINNTRTGWQFWGHNLPAGVGECLIPPQMVGDPPAVTGGCDVGSIPMALEVIEPLELEGWAFAIGGHTDTRVAHINGGHTEGDGSRVCRSRTGQHDPARGRCIAGNATVAPSHGFSLAPADSPGGGDRSENTSKTVSTV